jgi:uncharacterized protein YwgA
MTYESATRSMAMQGLIDIARLIHVCRKIDGRVKLQKMVHILQEAGYPFEEKFGYLHHGPYSSDLKREIDQLVDWQLVKEEPQPVISYTQYSYCPSDELTDVLKAIGADAEPEWQNLARKLNGEESQILEGISTIMFLQRRGFTGERLCERFTGLKPNLADRFEKCLREAERIRNTSLAAHT